MSLRTLPDGELLRLAAGQARLVVTRLARGIWLGLNIDAF